jgi:hypothetical protein
MSAEFPSLHGLCHDLKLRPTLIQIGGYLRAQLLFQLDPIDARQTQQGLHDYS